MPKHEPLREEEKKEQSKLNAPARSRKGLALPILNGEMAESSLLTDGRRKWIYPADVRGKWTHFRKALFVVLIAIWMAMPLINIGGAPAVFLDIETRRFFLFGTAFNAQDTFLLLLLGLSLGFALMAITAIASRIFCGYLCPQTVFMEAFFRPIERLIGGSREKRMRRDQSSLTFDRVWRSAFIQALNLFFSVLTAHILMSYFVSLPKLWSFMHQGPSEHPHAFLLTFGLSALLFFNFAWFREQFCVVVCPYGRMQSVLTDEHSLVIGYDRKRGEPRGKAIAKKAKKEGAENELAGQPEQPFPPSYGDCVDCKRCIVVCPTGIDIRNGHQLDCVGCAACIDACDEIMGHLKRQAGLIRYDSSLGLLGRSSETKMWRPRTIAYGALALTTTSIFAISLYKRTDFECNLVRLPGPPYVVQDKALRNAFQLHLVNKASKKARVHLQAKTDHNESYLIPQQDLELEPLAHRSLPFFVYIDLGRYQNDFPFAIELRYEGEKKPELKTIQGTFLGSKLPMTENK